MTSYRAGLVLLWGIAGCAFNPAEQLGNNAPDADVAIDASDDGDTSDGPDVDAATIDAAMIDAAMIDAPAIDAAMIDAPMIDAAIDAPPPVGDVVHVADDSIGTGDLTITADITTVTSGGGFGFGMALPPGVTFTTASQDPSGPELAVLRVRNLTISTGADVRVTGTRPLVILAEMVILSGTIDAGARQSVPGGGGAAAGVGAGGNGQHLGRFSDGGGGGGSFGALGGSGGDAACNDDCNPNATAQGGGPGSTYGTASLVVLEGGSGGGRAYFPPSMTACPAGAPGAGGGAVQIAARTSITIGAAGGINVGGGGGTGGDRCNSPFNWLAGHGGGSGGAIYLQSPVIQSAGVLASNGGGGGSGAGQDGDGRVGSDGALGTNVATGGTANGTLSADGGDGASGSSAGEGGSDAADNGNGGGGGGGTGRIHLRYRTTLVGGTASPTATTSTY